MVYADLLQALPSAGKAEAIDLSTTDYVPTHPVRRIYVGGTGDVKVDMADGTGSGVIFKTAPVGFLDVRASKVYRSGTTATNLVAVW